jgi:hypothetical protein
MCCVFRPAINDLYDEIECEDTESQPAAYYRDHIQSPTTHTTITHTITQPQLPPTPDLQAHEVLQDDQEYDNGTFLICSASSNVVIFDTIIFSS